MFLLIASWPSLASGKRVTYYISPEYQEVWEDGKRIEIIKHYYVNGQKVATRDKEGLKYHYSDHLGSASQLADDHGNQIKIYWYTPFGSDAEEAGSATARYKYNDKEHDNTGWYYYGARYYDPEVGRFMRADSVLPALYDPQQLNRFAYVRNNPVMLIDPDGHAAQKMYDLTIRSTINTPDIYRGLAVETVAGINPKDKHALNNYGDKDYESILENYSVIRSFKEYKAQGLFETRVDGMFTTKDAIKLTQLSGWEWDISYVLKEGESRIPDVDHTILQTSKNKSFVGGFSYNNSVGNIHTHVTLLNSSFNDVPSFSDVHTMNYYGESERTGHLLLDSGEVILYSAPGTPGFQPDVWDEKSSGWVDYWNKELLDLKVRDKIGSIDIDWIDVE